MRFRKNGSRNGSETDGACLSILTLASYDERVKDISVSNSLRQCIQLISEFPLLQVYGYHGRIRTDPPGILKQIKRN